MKNRLLLSWQRRLLTAVCLTLWTLSLNAQCECFSENGNTCTGDVFSLTYIGPDTIYVGADCMGTLATGGMSSLNISPVPTSQVLFISGGYMNGSSVPAGTEVIYEYHLSDGMTSDTLCFSIHFVDTIPPESNYSPASNSDDCQLADYASWWQAHVDSLEANATDNCGVDTIYHSGPATFTDNCGMLNDTFYIVDIHGNVSFELASYTITDSNAPAFSAFPPDTTIQCSAIVPSPASAVVSVTDDCAAMVTPIYLGADTTNFAMAPCGTHQYTIERTWRVTDGCGNTTDSTQNIFIVDTTMPDFTVPADTTVACTEPTDTMALGTISNISDNCSTNPVVSFTEAVSPSALCPQELTITRTWTVTDDCGNSQSKSQVINVVDDEAPTANFPADMTVACGDDAQDLNIVGQPTMVMDNCHMNPTISRVDVFISGSCAQSFSIERTWKVEDACNNSVEDIQIITVYDSIPPVINTQAIDQSVTCDVDILLAFANWVSAHGAAQATDNCAHPDSLQWSAFNSGTANPAMLPGPDCMNPVPGIFRQQAVDFIVSDKCGNRDTTTATFTVTDIEPPTIVNCPSDITVNTDPGQCESFQVLNLPMVTENCGNTTVQFNPSIALTPTIPPGSDPIETPIDDLVYNFSVQGPPYSAQTDATLTIELENLDAEAPTEILEVYGEDGSLLGTVANTTGQCGDTLSTFTITSAQIDMWAFDGTITITVVPNIPANLPGRFAVNSICPGNLVTATLEYDADFPAGLQFEYSINGGGRIPVSPVAPLNEVFGTGTNVVDYYFIDCAANESSCSFNITVEDNEPPVIDCPADQSIDLDPGVCEMDVEVPLFNFVSDNCGVTTPSVQTQPGDSLSQLITFSYNPNLGDYVADDKVFTFSNLQGNATPGGVQLIITVQGDIDSVGAYFEIYDNDGNFLGTTAKGQPNTTAGDCNTPGTAVFTIPATLFNDWASSGDIVIEARSFMNYPIPPGGPGWGINPCDPGQVTADGDTDGSFITATFSYESVTPVFMATGATSIDPVTLNPPLEAETYTLNQGTTTFTYMVTDLAGNDGSCTFEISVNDVEPPVALCGPAFVDINPSGFDQDTVFAFEIDLGSSDNCSIASMTVTPNIFDCNDEGTQNVTLTVTDQVGNVSVCSTFVNVTTQAPVPTASSDCGSSDLQLFANPPASSGGNNNIYNYTWLNPDGVAFAFTENPVIQDADINDLGFYTVIVEGVTSCESMASVQVTCDLLPLQQPVLQAASTNICASEMVELSTSTVCGTSVQYNWYSGNFPGVLLATTSQPNYSMLPQASGMYNFYVIVERNGCSSAVSNTVQVQVNMAPVAMAADDNIVACVGEQIQFNSINVPQGATCHWSGPSGYESFNCNPAPINNVQSFQGGFYTLTVTNNGCPSIPDTVSVTIVSIPAQPSVSNSTSSNNPACTGETITLTATQVSGAVSYQWTSPVFATFSTPTNVLTIPSANIAAHAGQWTVKVIGNPCESNQSAPTTVYIEPLPLAVTAAINPDEACEGQNVQLSAGSATQNVNYLWTYPNGQTNALQNPVLQNITTANNGTYTLTVTSQFGCSREMTVTLDVLDRVDITAVSSDAPSCTAGPVDVHLMATVFPIDDGSYEYLWTGPGGFISTNASATISNGTSDDSGPYTLVVTNSDGCSSLPATVDVAIPEALPTPGSPQLSSPNPFCEGDAVTLTTTPYNGASVQYLWSGPSATFTTTSPSLTLNNLTVSESGAYTVVYQSGDCVSATSGSTTLQVNPTPLIQPTSNSPVCEGNVIQLQVNCTTGATYEWSGPGSFSSSVCNPIIPNANPDLHSGTYTVRKRVGGCWSDEVNIAVEVKEKPDVPTAVNAGPYCANTENVILSVTSNSATPGATYTWFDENGVPLGNTTPSLNFTVPDAELLGNGNFEFYVQAFLDGCPSTPSVPTVVTINTIPGNSAEAGENIDACDGDIITLQATTPTIGNGFWTLIDGNPNGVSIANPDEPSTTVSGLMAGSTYTFQWSLSNGACTDYSTDVVEVFVNQLEQADAGEMITACQMDIVTLDANMPVSNVGEWSQPLSQAMLGVEITDPSDPQTSVTGLIPGNNYIFTWTIDGGCGASSDAVLVTVTNEVAFAGADAQDCGDGCTEMNAVSALSGMGMWTSPDPGLEIISPSDPLTTVCNLKEGENILIWTIDGGACGHFSIDSVIVDYQFVPIGADDFANVAFAGTTTVNVTDNDDVTGLYTLNVVQQPQNGEVELDGDGNMTYEADVNFVGEDIVVYEICSDGCECVSATVTFNVGENADCMTPSIITPNGDGMNDAFIVPCLGNSDRFPTSAVSIFNQWGDEVFKASPYQNDWRGTFDGENLPAGTYFYIVDLGNGETPLSGYLILQR